MSRASRKRLLEKVARLELRPQAGQRRYATMVTLTYGGAESSLPTIEEAKDHKRAFVERLRRRFPGGSGIVRLEFDSSGARDYHPHWHFILFNVPWLDKVEVNRWWSDIVGPRWASRWSTRIEAVRTLRGVLYYAAKYAAKAGGGLVNAAYPHAVSRLVVDAVTGEIVEWVEDPAELVHTGRVWSVWNRAHLPYAARRVVHLARGGWFFDVKRAARGRWAGVNGLAWAGFALFCGDPGQWVEMAEVYAGAGGDDAVG
jgi:hypothetical protein